MTSSKLSPEQRVDRATRWKRWAEEDGLYEAMDLLKAEYVKAWDATSSGDTDARERLWQAYQIVGKVKSHIGQVMADGSLARAEIKELKKGRKSFF